MEYGASFADAVYTTVRYTFIDFSTEYWSWISPNLLQMIAFFLLGHVFALGIVKKTNKTKVQAIYTEMETLKPIAGAEAENYALYTDSDSD